eukprot:CAMPEP_0204326782 /NCGR_PEP_ID=MMETSP0469-20131031/12092_1 /ASSEMBLY_ACC=CAM_ASM_000384 /TAXON_ID=2969 /ORGANISM="Oxyrrhis marina" /LENGTH=65 /DNA_ID=CAMNT_0051308899 /DNA_START=91 /DNA_END=285 /DNA_ORIENTATION=+
MAATPACDGPRIAQQLEAELQHAPPPKHTRAHNLQNPDFCGALLLRYRAPLQATAACRDPPARVF